MWYNDVKLVSGFGEALANAGVLEDSADFSGYLAKPQRWNDEYEVWEAAEFPTTEDDDGWDAFVEGISDSDAETDES